MIHWDEFDAMFVDLGHFWSKSNLEEFQDDFRALSELRTCSSAVSPGICFFVARVLERAVGKRFEGAKFSLIKRNYLPSAMDERIDFLGQYGMFRADETVFAHEIRRLGNRARHQAAFPRLDQAEFCLCMFKMLMPWISESPAIQALCDRHALTSIDNQVAWLAKPRAFADYAGNAGDLLARIHDLCPASREDAQPVPNDLMTWVVQRCIDAGRLELAGELMKPCLFNRNPDSPQLPIRPAGRWAVTYFSRLLALRLTRLGRPDDAIDFLVPLARRAGYLHDDGLPSAARTGQSHAYVESLGILAGCHKTRWFEHGQVADLQHARLLYAAAASAAPWSIYPAINVAACEAWLGNFVAASQKATDLIEKTMRPLEAAVTGWRNLPWTQFTLAEALLLSGRHAEAVSQYAVAAMSLDQSSRGILAKAVQQVQRHQHSQVIPQSLCARIEAAVTTAEPRA